MSSDRGALASMADTLDQLLARLNELNRVRPDSDQIAAELQEVERQLETASRRLRAALRRSTR